jgi:hypothetical protein
MANKKISELESRASLSLSDLMAVGDPSTGYLYKTTISDLKTLTGAGVVSFNGRFGTVNPAEGDYTLTQLGDVIITSATNGQVLQYNGSNWVNSSLNLTTTLAALTDVTISSIANNQLLRYNSTSQKWENWTPNYLTSESDTLNSVTGRGNTTANSITVGSVTAAGLSNLLGEIRTFATTGNTYIGASPASASDAGYKLDLNGTARISGDMTMWDDGTNNGNSRALIFRALGSTGNAQTGQIILDGFGAAGQDQLQLSASSIRLSPSTGSVTITGTTPNISTVAASGFRLNANSTTNGFTFTQAYNQTSGDLLAVFTNSNQKKFSIAASDSSVTIASLSGTGSRMVVADANGVLSTQAIADLSGYVTLSTTQTITGAKTFSNVTTFNQNIVGGIIKLSQGVLLSKSAAVGTDAGFLSLIATSATGLNYINIADGDAPSNTQRFAIPNTGTYTYTFPAASGTVALTSDIPSVAGVYLPLSGGTLTGSLLVNAENTYIAIDAQSTPRLGFVKKSGSQPFLAFASDPFSIRVSSGTDVSASNTFVTALSIATTGAATFSNTVTAGGYYVKHTNGNTIAAIEQFSGTQGAGFSLFNSSGTQNVLFNAGGSSFIRGGFVGINTASPNANLEILGDNEGEYFRAGGGTISGRSLTFSSVNISGFSGVGHRINVPNSSGQLFFAIAGTDRLTINSSGNAIFSSSIIGDVYFMGQVPTYGTSNAQFSHKDRSGAGEYSFLSASDGTTYVNAKTGTDINFRINNINIAIMKSDGKFGINNSSPAYRIDAVDGGGSFLQLYQNDGTYNRRLIITGAATGGNAGITLNATSSTGSDNMIFATASVERMRINGSGTYVLTNTTYSTSDDQNTITFNQTYPSSYNIAQIAVRTDGYYYAGAISFRTADQYSANTLTERMRISSLGNVEIPTGSLKTSSPTGGTAQPWKFGEATNTLYTATRTVKVEINGALYYLLAVASSDL